MRLSRHPNIMELHCSFVVGADLWLVMPLMDKGSCFFIMRALRARGAIREGEGIGERFICIILKEVLQGLQYLHEDGQVHRDLKAGNILVNSDGQVKLGDFGVAGWLNEYKASRTRGTAETFVGTPCWMAPEVMEQTKGYNVQVDIWSLGITALELAKGVAPYSHFAPMQVIMKTLREPPPSLATYAVTPGMAQPQLSSQFNSFVARCLDKDPEKRPSAAELLKDKFFKRAGSPTELRELLDQVPSVSSGSAPTPADRPAGYAGVVLVAGGEGGGAEAAESEFVPGTTWRFPEDEPVTGDRVTGEEVSAAVQSLIDCVSPQADEEDDDGEGSETEGAAGAQ